MTVIQDFDTEYHLNKYQLSLTILSRLSHVVGPLTVPRQLIFLLCRPPQVLGQLSLIL